MTARLKTIEIDCDWTPPTPESRQEQQVAIFDLLEDNSFALPAGAPDGPYDLTLRCVGKRLGFDLSTGGAEAGSFELSLGPLRQIVKDYHDICASYYEAVKTSGAAEIEALDEARRAIHAEGARVLQERLDGKAAVDDDTSRRLFTLVAVLTSEA